uniref:non-specific serine/threonine protein kinase n=1 Tax=Callorhinchus milii TaxID=7868 RepID=A0A4W3JT35_CALMI
MMYNFCPECGNKIEADFNFCPNCGVKIPKTEEEVCPTVTQSAGSPALSPHKVKETKLKASPAKNILSRSLSRRPIASPKRKREVEERGGSSPSTAVVKSPKGKRHKYIPLTPISENEILTDQNNKKWKLIKLLNQDESGLLYSATASAASKQCSYIIKVDAKDGRIFNEQNFLQRAAKQNSVEKWMKSRQMMFLGIPPCVGFGSHPDNYRFLVFPNFGKNLQTILEESKKPLSEKAVLQLSYRMIDVLEYIHENEYVHGDIKAENIYVNPSDLKQVYLVGYYFAFRYCPGGKHVEYREGSRTPHEGTVELISVDSHKGVGPSRRSDLETLGYCVLKALCHSLPWSEKIDDPNFVMEEKQRYKADIPSLLKYCFGKRKVPGELKNYLEKVMSLDYDEKPDYEELQDLLKRGLQRLRSSVDDPVDLWINAV